MTSGMRSAAPSQTLREHPYDRRRKEGGVNVKLVRPE